MRLIEEFVNELGNIFEKSDISILPSEMANIKGVFEGFEQVSKQMKS